MYSKFCELSHLKRGCLSWGVLGRDFRWIVTACAMFEISRDVLVLRVFVVDRCVSEIWNASRAENQVDGRGCKKDRHRNAIADESKTSSPLPSPGIVLLSIFETKDEHRTSAPRKGRRRKGKRNNSIKMILGPNKREEGDKAHRNPAQNSQPRESNREKSEKETKTKREEKQNSLFSTPNRPASLSAICASLGK